MPLPNEAINITGGCSCGAIRYRVAIPELSLRPHVPFVPKEADLRLPDAATCHCNDCRRHTGSPLPAPLLQVPSPMITVSILDPADSSADSKTKNAVTGRILDVLDAAYDAAKADSARPSYRPAMDVLRAIEGSGVAARGATWLRFFHSFDSGENLSRSFCGRCGTHFCFHFKLKPEFCHDGKLPNGWADMFDLYTGTVDRQFLEGDWLVPNSEVNFEHGTHLGRTASASAKYFKHIPKFDGLGVGEVTKDEIAALAAE